eukprot:tig00001487_g8947.t1
MMRRFGNRALMGAVTSFGGKPNGFITVSQTEARRWTEDEERLLGTVAEQMGSPSSQLLREEQQQRELLASRNAALEEARREADAASRTKSQFLAMVSHEVRTPMNAILNMADFLLETELSALQRDYCATIQNSSAALLNILRDILDTSRLEFGKVEIRRAPSPRRPRPAGPPPPPPRPAAPPPAPRAGSSGAGAGGGPDGPSAAQKGLDLSYHVAASCPAMLHADGPRLTQILINLIGNGVKFTHSGEVSLRLSCEARRPPAAPRQRPRGGGALSGRGGAGGALRAVIRTRGSGSLRRTRRSSSPGSTGRLLPLPPVRRHRPRPLHLAKLALLMGGDIEARSEEGRGSTSFSPSPRLPCRPEASPRPRSRRTGRRRGAGRALALAGRAVALWTRSEATAALVQARPLPPPRGARGQGSLEAPPGAAPGSLTGGRAGRAGRAGATVLLSAPRPPGPGPARPRVGGWRRRWWTWGRARRCSRGAAEVARWPAPRRPRPVGDPPEESASSRRARGGEQAAAPRSLVDCVAAVAAGRAPPLLRPPPRRLLPGPGDCEQARPRPGPGPRREPPPHPRVRGREVNKRILLLMLEKRGYPAAARAVSNGAEALAEVRAAAPPPPPTTASCAALAPAFASDG